MINFRSPLHPLSHKTSSASERRRKMLMMKPRDAELETFFVPFLLFHHHQWVMRWETCHLESAFSPHVVYFLYYFYAISFFERRRESNSKHLCWHDMFNIWMIKSMKRKKVHLLKSPQMSTGRRNTEVM